MFKRMAWLLVLIFASLGVCVAQYNPLVWVNPRTGFIYPTEKTFESLQAALNAAVVRGGGTVDARALTNLTLSAEIAVGALTNVPVHLLMPNSCLWTSTMVNPSAFVLRVYNKSSVESYGSGEGNPCVIQAGAGSNVSVICGSDPSNSLYIRMTGFACTAAPGSVVNNGVLVFGSAADESYVGHMTGTAVPGATVSRVLWIHSACCSATYEDINADAEGTPGTVPCLFGNGTGDSSTAVSVSKISCVHPGVGQYAFIDQENGGCNNRFESVYMEESPNQDQQTPYMSIQAAGPTNCADIFEGFTANNDVPGSVRYVVDLAPGTHFVIRDLRTSDTSVNVINDHNGGGTGISRPVGSTLFLYSSEQ